jgi:hypothetical protein
MEQSTSAHDILAFAIVEGWTVVPYDTLLSIGPTDTLYKALLSAYKEKERRADSRAALLCAVMANCMSSGGKKYEVSDFMPKAPKTAEQEALDVKSQLMKYMASKQQ